MHRIAQRANAGDADFHDVSSGERADASRRASGDHVAWEERHHTRNITHQKSDGIDHERGATRLEAGAVYVRFDEHIRRIKLRLDVRADGTKGVKALGAGELDVTLLEIAGGDVVEAGIAQEVGQGIVGIV